MNLRKQLIKNVLSNWTFLFLNFVIFFFLSPYMIAVLGTARVGIWAMLGSISGYFGIIAFGIPAATSKYVAQFLATDDRDQVNRIVSTSMFLSLGIGLLAAVAAAFLWLNIDSIFKIKAAHVSEARAVMFIVGVDLALGYTCGLMINVLKGFNRDDVRNAVLIPALLVKGAGFYLTLKLGGGVAVMVGIQLAVNVLGYLTITLWLFRHAPWLRVRLRDRDRALYRLLFVYSAFQFLAMAADRIILHTDKWIIGGVIGTATVTVYHIAAQLRGQTRLISSGLGQALRPASSHLHALGDYAGLRTLMVTGARVLLVMLGGICVLYATWGDRFVSLWQYALTKQDVTQVYGCLMILIAPVFLTVVLGPGVAIMYGMAKHRPHAVLGIIVAAVNVGLSYWLAHPLGIYGVAIGTALPVFFIRGLYMYWYLPHIVRMRPWDFIAGAWGRPLLGLVPLAAVLTGLRFVLDFDRLLWLMLFFFVIGALYVAWVYLVVLTKEEKCLVHDIMAGKPFKTEREGPST